MAALITISIMAQAYHAITGRPPGPSPPSRWTGDSGRLYLSTFVTSPSISFGSGCGSRSFMDI
jgi:hypothetical protein